MKTQNERQRELRSGVKQKYTAYLNEMYKLTQNNEFIHVNNLCESFKIGTRINIILQNEKIIKKLGQGKYIWISKKPTIEMVDRVIEIQRYMSTKGINKNTLNNQKEIDFEKPVKKPIEKPVVRILNPTKEIINSEIKAENKKYSFSIFWGLVKIQKS
jgi:hypothetical protein